MDAVVLSNGSEITIQDIPEPNPQPGEVLLKSEYCGICGTDLHATVLKDLFVPNVIMGHEFAGTVIDIGKNVEGWTIGDKAAINPNGNICGECEQCRRGYPNLCFTAVRLRAIGVHRDGGMAKLVSLPMQILHKLPDKVSTLQGAWVEPLATALRGVRSSGVTVGSTTLIIGAGPIGLLTMQILKHTGVSNIIVIEPSSFRRDKAKMLGADFVLDPSKDNVSTIIGSEIESPDYIFECSGHPSSVNTAVQLINAKGVITVIGVSPELLTIDAGQLIFKEATIRGSIIYVDEFQIAIRLLERDLIDIETLTTEVIALKDFQHGFDRLSKAGDAIKILMKTS